MLAPLMHRQQVGKAIMNDTPHHELHAGRGHAPSLVLQRADQTYLLIVDDDVRAPLALPKADRITVGRGQEALVRISAASVSALHVEIRFDVTPPMMRDLWSTHGTFVRGQRLQADTWCVMPAGGEPFRIGNVTVALFAARAEE